jgi:hypothetical protein
MRTMKQLSLEHVASLLGSTQRRQCPAHAMKVFSDQMMANLLHPLAAWFILMKIDQNPTKSSILAWR